MGEKALVPQLGAIELSKKARLIASNFCKACEGSGVKNFSIEYDQGGYSFSLHKSEESFYMSVLIPAEDLQ